MRRIALLSFALLLLPLAARADDPKPLAEWRQLGPGGSVETRAVVDGAACPAAMQQRVAASADFPLVCAASAATPKLDAERILVLGDTGCRIKDTLVQPCNDPAAWPFASLAAAAAKLRPDVVVHVGDYLYRESPCPAGNTGCAGTPWGNNWATWKADFFDPAAPLLAAAPWVIVRGNHEDCSRSGPGWLRLLGPLTYQPAGCTSHVAPYAIPLKPMNLIVMDDADASDILAPSDQVAVYRGDFASVAKLASSPSWLIMHRPIWGVVKLPLGMVTGGNSTMMAALDSSGIPSNIALLVAGHIHTFEAINYVAGAPPQILAGEGGDLLDQAPADLTGQTIGRMKISSGLSLPGYGFLLFTHSGSRWSIDVRAADGSHERTCIFASARLDCGKS